jgi:hypothetical protein
MVSWRKKYTCSSHLAVKKALLATYTAQEGALRPEASTTCLAQQAEVKPAGPESDTHLSRPWPLHPQRRWWHPAGPGLGG